MYNKRNAAFALSVAAVVSLLSSQSAFAEEELQQVVVTGRSEEHTSELQSH